MGTGGHLFRAGKAIAAVIESSVLRTWSNERVESDVLGTRVLPPHYAGSCMNYPWHYDESIQVGTDYRAENEVRAYNRRYDNPQWFKDTGERQSRVSVCVRLRKMN